MDAHAAFPFLKEIILFLVLSGVLIQLLARLRINPVLGFLAVGTLLGPTGSAASRPTSAGWTGSPSPTRKASRPSPSSA